MLRLDQLMLMKPVPFISYLGKFIIPAYTLSHTTASAGGCDMPAPAAAAAAAAVSYMMSSKRPLW